MRWVRKAGSGSSRRSRSVSSACVPGGVDHRVAAQPVADRLQQRGLVLALARSRRRGGVATASTSLPFHPLPGHPVGAAAFPQFRLGGCRLDRVPMPSWLLTITYTIGSVPQRGQVQRLVERAMLVVASPAGTSCGRVRRRRGRRGRTRRRSPADLAADDPYPPIRRLSRSNRCIDPPGARTARRPVRTVRPSPGRGRRRGQRVPVLAVGGEQVVTVAEGGGQAGHGGFLAEVEVAVAADPGAGYISARAARRRGSAPSAYNSRKITENGRESKDMDRSRLADIDSAVDPKYSLHVGMIWMPVFPMWQKICELPRRDNRVFALWAEHRKTRENRSGTGSFQNL